MKRAQNVAQAVVRTRSTLSAWSCMGARRRAVGITPTEKFSETSLIIEENPDSPTTVTSHPANEPNMDHGSSSDGSGSRSGLGHDDTDEDEPLISVDHGTSQSEHITEGELLYELEKELQRQENEAHIQAQKEEEAAAQEIIEEEKVIADSVDHEQPISSSDTLENQHLYPPGRIMHIVSTISNNPVDPDNNDHDAVIEEHEHEHEHEHVGIYETPRDLYGKLRLSRTMINDHYMPMYKKMMEKLLVELETQV